LPSTVPQELAAATMAGGMMPNDPETILPLELRSRSSLLTIIFNVESNIVVHKCIIAIDFICAVVLDVIFVVVGMGDVTHCHWMQAHHNDIDKMIISTLSSRGRRVLLLTRI
jgi:hypothetical protein